MIKYIKSVLTVDEDEADQHQTDFHVLGSDGFRLTLFFFSGRREKQGTPFK